MKSYLKSLAYFWGIIFIGILIFSLLHYFNILGTNILKILKIILVLISSFISSFLLGKASKKKGFIEGLKLGIIITLIFIIINLLIKTPFKLTIIFYYTILTLTTMLGSMIGINKKKTTT